MDPWYPLGSHDMLEVASMALHVGHMTGQNDERMFSGCNTISCRDYVLGQLWFAKRVMAI